MFINMIDLSDFQRCPVVATRIDGGNIRKTAEMFVTDSNEMTAYAKKEQNAPHPNEIPE